MVTYSNYVKLNGRKTKLGLQQQIMQCRWGFTARLALYRHTQMLVTDGTVAIYFRESEVI